MKSGLGCETEDRADETPLEAAGSAGLRGVPRFAQDDGYRGEGCALGPQIALDNGWLT